MNSSLAIAFLFLSAATCRADETRVKMSELPPAVQEAVKKIQMGAKVHRVLKDVMNKRVTYEAQTTVEGRGRDIVLDSSGTVVQVEETVPLSTVPAGAKAAIEKLAGKRKLLRVELVTQGDTVVAYTALIRQGWKKVEYRLDPEGNILPQE